MQLRAALLSLVCLLAASKARAQGPDEPLAGRVISVSSDGRIEIDIGDNALKGGDVGVIQRDGAQVGLATVLWVDLGVTRLRVASVVPGEQVKVGDVVVFADRKDRANVEGAPPPLPHAGPGAVGPARDEFVPLLAPVAPKKTALARGAAVFHGRLRASEVYQTVAPSKAWYRSSRLDTDGSVERVGGGAWSLDWAGNASRRDGSVFSSADDFRRVQPHLYRGALTRKSPDGSFVRLGRFYPAELSGIGYVDGAQADAAAAPHLRAGAAGGARPDRQNMGFATRERVAAGYLTVEAGEYRRLYSSSSLGLLKTFYEGKGDELAALWDQRADLGPKLSLFGNAQLDFHTASAARASGTRLTRLNLNANSPVSDSLSLRAGANHYEPLDTAADHALAGGTTVYLNNGYWRYSFGSAQSLPAGFQLDEDLSYTDTSGRWTPGQWRLTLGRRGLPGSANAYASLAAYSLYNPAGPDYGATAVLSLPTFSDRLTWDGNVGARLGPTSVARRRLRVSDASVRASWRPSAEWSLDAGLTRSWQESVHSTIANGAVTWRW